MGISDAVIAGRCCRVLVNAKACVKTHAHVARLARPLAPLITRVCGFQASPVLTKKKSRKAGLSWCRTAVSVPFLPKSGATVADAQKSITRLQHLFIPLLNA